MNLLKTGWTAFVAVGIACAGISAQAGVITRSGALTTQNMVTFDTLTLANGTKVTNQYAAKGLTFSGSAYTNGCGPGAWANQGITGNFMHTNGPGCGPNGVADAFSMKFSTDVNRFSMRLSASDSNRNDFFTVLNNGQVVTTFNVFSGASTISTSSGSCTLMSCRSGANFRGFLNIDNLVFDELRFTEVANDNSYLIFDNVGFSTANVPEPATWALFGAGIVGLAYSRRKRAKA